MEYHPAQPNLVNSIHGLRKINELRALKHSEGVNVIIPLTLTWSPFLRKTGEVMVLGWAELEIEPEPRKMRNDYRDVKGTEIWEWYNLIVRIWRKGSDSASNSSEGEGGETRGVIHTPTLLVGIRTANSVMTMVAKQWDWGATPQRNISTTTTRYWFSPIRIPKFRVSCELILAEAALLRIEALMIMTGLPGFKMMNVQFLASSTMLL